jgi:4-hydroxy-3-methylbut-2-enyl diphosphate reductase
MAARSRASCNAPPTSTGTAGQLARLGITAGASAPELLVDELIEACRTRYDVTVEEVRTTEESVVFKLPRALVA